MLDRGPGPGRRSSSPSTSRGEIRRGRPAEAQVLVDATDSNTARLTRGSAGQITARLRAAVRRRERGARDPDRHAPVVQSRAASRGSSTAPASWSWRCRSSRPCSPRSPCRARASSRRSCRCTCRASRRTSSCSARSWPAWSRAWRSGCSSVGLMFTLFGLRFAGDPTPLVAGSVLFVFCVVSFGSLVGAAIPNQAAAVQAVGARRLPPVLPPLRPHLPDREHSRRAALDLEPGAGPLLRRRRARRLPAGRRLARRLVGGAGDRRHRPRVLRPGLADDAAHAGEGVRRAWRGLFGGRFWALALKELRQIRRDRRLTISLIVPPTLQVLLFGFALDSEVRNLRLGVVDESRTVESRELISALTENRDVPARRLLRHLRGARARPWPAAGLDVGVVVPYDFARRRARGQPGHRAGAAQRRQREHRADRPGLRGGRGRLAQPSISPGRARPPVAAPRRLPVQPGPGERLVHRDRRLRDADHPERLARVGGHDDPREGAGHRRAAADDAGQRARGGRRQARAALRPAHGDGRRSC